MKEIWEDNKYYVFRLNLVVTLDGYNMPLKVDITTKDKITPGAVKYSFKLFIQDKNTEVLAYNIEKILIEKLNQLFQNQRKILT